MQLIKFYDIALSGPEMAKIPENELICFTHFTNIANELSFLRKLMLMLMPSDASTESLVERTARTMHVTFVLKMTCGLLMEAWKTIDHNYYNCVSKDYSMLLSDEGNEAIKKLKRYFASENIIRDIRNRFSFHYEQTIDRSRFEQEDKSLHIHLTEAQCNNVYGFAHQVFGVRMLEEVLPPTGPTDQKWGLAALGKLLDEVEDNIARMLAFIGCFVTAFAERHLQHKIRDATSSVEKGVDWREAVLPLFLDTSRCEGMPSDQL